jgi:hypothetical protein
MRLINSGNLHIKKQYAVWIYAPQNYEHGAAGGTDLQYPLGIAERWHRNLPSLAKERNPAAHMHTLPHCG